MTVAEIVRQRTRRVFFGWWIVAGAVGIQIIQMGLFQQSYGAYVAVLQKEFDWSATTFALAFAAFRAESGILGPIQGWMIDRFGPRAIMRVGNVIFGLGFMLLSQINSLTMFFVALIMIAIGSSLGGFMAIATTVANWFDRKRATALGIMQTGMSIGGMLVPVIAWSLVTFGWRETAFVSGIIVLVVALPLSQLMRRAPEEYGYLPDGAPSKPLGVSSPSDAGSVQRSVEQVEFTPRQALKTRAFWFISLAHAVSLLVNSVITVHLVLFLSDEVGFSLASAASIFTVVTAFGIVGQLTGGFTGERFGKRRVLVACMIGHGTGLLALSMAHSAALVLVFAFLQGICWGTRGPLLHALRAEYFGRRAFGRILGFSSMIMMIGTMGGPIFAGVMADQFGSYRLAFVLVGVLAIAASFLFLFAKPPRLAAQSTEVQPAT